MRLSIIVAMSTNRVIGIENRLPWNLSADLQYFKSITMGKPIIMGRKTFDSIGRALPGRSNIVISRNTDLQLPGCTVVGSPERAIEAALEVVGDSAGGAGAGGDGSGGEAMVIGGAGIYRQFIDHVQRIYLTEVHGEFDGDAWFPEFPGEWQTIANEDHLPADGNPGFSFKVLDRL